MLVAFVIAALALNPTPELEINFWYGPDEVFGELGRPQRQINILGNVASDAGVMHLFYSLNGGPESPLSIGPDTRRLLLPGDFNIELFLDDLAPGEHEVVVRAVDNELNETSRAHQFTLMEEQAWPLPFTARWMTAHDVTSVAQPVDGQWRIEGGNVRSLDVGYDRLLAIGDTTWTDYEVTVPITIHSVDPLGYLPPSYTPGIGIVLRWNGHTDFLEPGSQPTIGYWPLGGVAEFVYHVDQCGPRFQLYGNPFVLRAQDDFCTPHEFDVPYLWKFRVETLLDGTHEYKFKVWQQGFPEPGEWFLSMIEEAWQPAHGSMMLLVHHVDATFGEIQITRPDGPVAILPDFAVIRSRAKLFGDAVITGKAIYREVIRDGQLFRRFNVTIRNATPGQLLPVHLANELVGVIEVGQDGVGQLELRSFAFIDDPATQWPMPPGFAPIIDLDTVTVGNLSGVFFDAMYTLPEGQNEASLQYRIKGTFDDDATGLTGKVIYRERIKNGALDRRLLVHVTGGEPHTFRWFRLGMQKIERVWFDHTGAGSLELRSPAFITNHNAELPMPVSFPSLVPGDMVRLGPIEIELVE